MRTEILMVLGVTAALTVLGACDSTPTEPRGPREILLLVHPSAATLERGGAIHFNAVTQKPDDAVDPAEVLWTSSDAGIATVAPGGTVNAVGPGRAQITAFWRGKQAVADLSVIDGGRPACQPAGGEPSAAIHPLLAAEKRDACR